MGNCIEADMSDIENNENNENKTTSIKPENDENVINETNIVNNFETENDDSKEAQQLVNVDQEDKTNTTIPNQEKNKEEQDPDDDDEYMIVSISKHNNDRSELVKLFETSEDNFSEFVCEYPDKFVVATIDIMLDKTAVSEAETDLETILFHELRGSPELWLDLQPSIKNELKRKLLTGLNELEGSKKILILAHIIGIIATFEEWDELVPELTDLSSSKDGKLKTLGMIAGWKADRLKVHSLQIAKVIYIETLQIDDTNVSSFEALSLFRIMDPILKHVNDVALVMKIMKITVAFLLKLYVRNYETLALFDADLNVNLNKTIFNEMDCKIEESFETAKICLGLLHTVQFHHFDAIPLELRDELFFLSNMFLKICANKVKFGLIEFPETSDEWEQEEWHFACVAQNIYTYYILLCKPCSCKIFFGVIFIRELSDLFVCVVYFF